jgi:ribonuclease R
MAYTREQIVDFIRRKSSHPMKMRELAKALNISREEYPDFRSAVKALIDAGELVKLKRGRIGLAREMDMVVGPISISRGGIGFVEREGDAQDLLIPTHALHTALNGDRVMVRETGRQGDRRTAAVVRIVERAARNIVGTFHQGRHFNYVRPDNPRIHRDIYIPATETENARDGEKVVCELTVWDDPGLNPEGAVTERIGFPGQPGVDMKTVIKSYDLPEEFPEAVLDEAEGASAQLTKNAEEGRLDLTKECIYTIDPADAKDHDDAISIHRTTKGYRLGVHIADVSHYVETGTELDKEAFARGNSVYLPGMVIPMLPEILSNNVCSLKPNRRRLAFSVYMNIDSAGKLVSWQIADTVIKSVAKLSYEDVQDFFDNGIPAGRSGARIRRVADSLTLARELARLLSKRRFAEGSLDFDLPEAKITMNEKGEVIALSNKIRLESHRLIEEFMLAANRAVALEMFRKGLQFLYRVHDRPDMEKLQAFSHMMSRLGYKFPVSDTIRPRDLANFLERVKDAPEADFINELMLRSMAKAVYQRKNIGHFGLAFKHYTHFTSPIRRYPDLLVHRLLRIASDGTYPPAFAKRVNSIIDHVGDHCSETERVAEAAEREAVKVKQVQYMARHVGDEFNGIISGVTGFGFFVRLDNLGAEGLVRVSTIDDDYYHYDEQHYRLIGRRTGRTFRMGDPIKVGVLRVDKIGNEIELFLAGPAPGAQKPPGRRSLRDSKKKQKKQKQQKKQTQGKSRKEKEPAKPGRTKGRDRRKKK